MYYLNKDKSFKEIAENLNFSERSISRVLQEEGINTRLKIDTLLKTRIILTI